MDRIWNMTPHNVKIIMESRFEPAIRKNVAPATAPVFMDIPSDGILNAKLTSTQIEPFMGIPQYVSVADAVDPLPESAGSNDIIIVSRLYAAAYVAVHGTVDPRLRCIKDMVVDEADNSRILGCAGLERP